MFARIIDQREIKKLISRFIFCPKTLNQLKSVNIIAPLITCYEVGFHMYVWAESLKKATDLVLTLL